nr:MAG TPA: hypothetical protein [Caudoviricetes sp.]
MGQNFTDLQGLFTGRNAVNLPRKDFILNK